MIQSVICGTGRIVGGIANFVVDVLETNLIRLETKRYHLKLWFEERFEQLRVES